MAKLNSKNEKFQESEWMFLQLFRDPSFRKNLTLELTPMMKENIWKMARLQNSQIWYHIDTDSVFQPFSIRGTSGTLIIVWWNLNILNRTSYWFSGNPEKNKRNPSWKTLLYKLSVQMIVTFNEFCTNMIISFRLLFIQF